MKLGLAAGVGAAALGCVGVARGYEEKPMKVSMGFVGVGARGTVLLREVLRHGEVEVPAVCDIDEGNLNRGLDLVAKARGKRPEGYLKGPEDYRRLLAREGVNGGWIGTPPEGHARMTPDSVAAGKGRGGGGAAWSAREARRGAGRGPG